MASILVIDDDKIVREALTDILEIFHINVITAANGAEGIETFIQRTKDIDGIIIDRRMPNLDGLETLQKLREIQNDIPVIMSSGYGYRELDTNSTQEMPDAYLYKPYEIQELIDLVKRVILK